MKWDLESLSASLDQLIWGVPAKKLSRVEEWAVKVVRLVIVLARDVTHGQLTLRAMGLVYTTLLSIVPLLAISFSVLKAFGVHNQVEPMLLSFLEPLGDKGVEITANVLDFIENMNVGVLGGVGLALLLYTAVSLVHKVEEAFNYIWHVHRGRSIGERFSRYISALMVGPILIFAALGVTAGAMSLALVREAMQIEAIGWLALQVGRILPYALIVGAFAFLYIFIPNTRVRIGAAVLGGLIAGIVWQSAGWVFAQFVAASTRYAAIYSSFAIVILFMLWLYLSWLILLFGSSVSFYVQYPEYVVKNRGPIRLSNRMSERLALVVMSMIGRRHLEGGTPWTLDALSRELRMPIRTVNDVLMALQEWKILTTTGEEPPGWLPMRDLDQVSVKEVVDTVRAYGESDYLRPEALRGPESVERMVQRAEDAADAALRDTSIKDLAAEPSEMPEQRAWLTK
ncbi:MAG: YihY/virulence factor BrkB family protein [Betaproteobacteria bacterium]|nr:MAG: YihY/virulence factor BrkB family protein [Betaproteobacteria bacterium]